MNDGAVDARGRFWVGEVDLRAIKTEVTDLKTKKGRGRLWRVQKTEEGGWECEVVETGVVCGNGIGWSLDGRFSEFPFYLIYSISIFTVI